MAITISGDSPNLTSASLTTPTLTSPTFAGTPSGSIITSMTAQASTSGTSIDFTSIPSWVKRITVMFDGVSTSSTSFEIIQIGDSGGIETTGYAGACAIVSNGNSTAVNQLSSGFMFQNGGSGSYLISGSIVLTLLNASTNTWTASGITAPAGSLNVHTVGGSKSLSATLDRVRITTVNGTDTFDAGTINILYE
jgi:hypothetical protein